MPFKAKTKVVHGSTADIVLEIVQVSDLALTTPDGTPTITITDPDGTDVVSAVAMTLESTGRYVYFYDTSTSDHKGNYVAEMAVDVDTGAGTRTEEQQLRFEVI